jgi:hypothetical protein
MMKLIVGYKVIGLDIFIPIRNWEHDGLYYALRGYEFEAVWE